MEEEYAHPLADVLSLLAQRLGVGDRVVRDGREQFFLVLAYQRDQFMASSKYMATCSRECDRLMALCVESWTETGLNRLVSPVREKPVRLMASDKYCTVPQGRHRDRLMAASKHILQ